MRACLITNPRSGRGQLDLTVVLATLRAQGWDVVTRQKTRGGEATKLARAAGEEGYDIVVACAGDGTVSEVVDGLAGSDVAVGVLPGGTANLWAHELGLSPRLEVAALQLAGAERRRVDVGHVSVNGRHGRHFLLMAGLGFDGAVMARVSKPLKQRVGVMAVGLAALQALPSWRPVFVRAELDGLTWQGKVSQVIVGNTRRYGGFTRVTPDAFIDDGLLDICLITAANLPAAGGQLASLLFRKHPGTGSAESYRAASLIIQASEALPLQVDGGAVRLKKETPTTDGMIYRFSVRARGITMLVPRGYNGELFQPGAHSASLDGITGSSLIHHGHSRPHPG
ncbi:MAG TPA: diacylglycerol kinase family protein, partial [Chloroflexota bacterium]